MNKPIPYTFAAAFAFAGAVSAQQVSPPALPLPPDGKLLGQLSEYRRCTINYQYLPKGNSSLPSKENVKGLADVDSEAPASVTITHTPKILSQVTKAVSGKVGESWVIENKQINRNEYGLFETPMDRESAQFISVAKGDFSEFEWIRREHFSGEQILEGRKVWLFRKSPSSEISSDHSISVAPNTPVMAVIDADSRLPLVLQEGRVRKIYEFSALPPVEQTVPEDITAYIQEQERRHKIATTPAPRPF